MSDVRELVKRLRKIEHSTEVRSGGVATNWHRNPDGPEAADAICELLERHKLAVDNWTEEAQNVKAQQAEIERQQRTIDELRNALACEMDDTRNACGHLNAEIERLRSRLADTQAGAELLSRQSKAFEARLAEAERNEETLLGMIRHQRDVLRECLPYLYESMAGRRPGRCADDIRAAVKALTADSGDERDV